MKLQFDARFAQSALPEDWLSARLGALEAAQAMLEAGNGPGGEFTGWVCPSIPAALLAQIKRAAADIRAQSQALVIVGIGGSYLGARALLELLQSPNYNLLHQPQIFFAGNSLSPDAMQELLALLKDRPFSVNVISKSGSTAESAAAFLILERELQMRYGPAGAAERIFVTTDEAQGALRETALANDYELFPLPANIGGRFSVLTAVGLLPLAVAGVDIDALLEGAASAFLALQHGGTDNPAWQYAAARNALLAGGKQVEVLASYEPGFRFFGEWWKQLFGESEGKEGKGLFPASVEFTADLHSMGQYIQDGPRHLFETVIRVERFQKNVTLPGGGADFLAGKDLQTLSDRAFEGTLLAHVDGGAPNLLLRLPERNARSVGELVYFFHFACGLSAYLLGVNPFNQPGVEAYKRNMMALLGKPGLEAEKAALEARFG